MLQHRLQARRTGPASSAQCDILVAVGSEEFKAAVSARTALKGKTVPRSLSSSPPSTRTEVAKQLLFEMFNAAQVCAWSALRTCLIWADSCPGRLAGASQELFSQETKYVAVMSVFAQICQVQ